MNIDDLLDEVQAFLNEENDSSEFELYRELECQLCAEDGHSECQGHYYSDETGYID